MPLPEVKLQSTGQAGPEVNRDLEVLQGRLNDALRMLNEMEKTLGSLTGGSSGSPPPVGGDEGGGDTGGGNGNGKITPIAPTSVATGNTTAAWATADISASVPSWATLAWVRDHIFGDNSADNAVIQYRRDSGSSTREGSEINPTGAAQSADDSGFRWIEIINGSFDYQVSGSLNAAAGAWEIDLEGYS